MRSHVMTSRALVAVGVASLALAGGLVTASPAAADPQVEVLAGGLVGPLSLAVDDDGTRYVTENFTGTLYRQEPGGALEPILHLGGGQELGGVSAEDGSLRFTATSADGTVGRVMQMRPGGGVRKLLDTSAYEAAHNPDGPQRYGFERISQRCAGQLPPEAGPASYTGIVETHPYNTDLVNGVTYLADAAGNDILRIEPDGTTSVVAVLPPARVTITPEGAEANGLPECTVGKVYRFEGVPTDVEMGPDGWLYVSSLPGGPEDPSLGANGRVLKINPANGKVKTLISGLAGAVGVGVAPNGDVYASQLFGGLIVKNAAGTNAVDPYVAVPLPADVDVADDGVYATINVLPSGPPDGQLVRITESDSSS